jgi:L-iditol 2-dehydrogenase
MLGTCVHAQRQVELLPWQTAAVVGLGVSGLLHLQLLRARGARVVVGVGRSTAKRQLALNLGASAVATPAEAVSILHECTRGAGADLVIEAAGTAETVGLAVALAAPGASVLLFGTVPGQGQPAPFYEMYRKELRLLSPRAATGLDYRDAVTLASSAAVSGVGLVSHRLPLDAAPGVLSAWRPDPDRLKVVFEP